MRHFVTKLLEMKDSAVAFNSRAAIINDHRVGITPEWVFPPQLVVVRKNEGSLHIKLYEDELDALSRMFSDIYNAAIDNFIKGYGEFWVSGEEYTDELGS